MNLKNIPPWHVYGGWHTPESLHVEPTDRSNYWAYRDYPDYFFETKEDAELAVIKVKLCQNHGPTAP